MHPDPESGSRKPPVEAEQDDPWEAVSRKTQAALRGEAEEPDADPGDTAGLLARSDGLALEAGPGSSNEILEVISQTLAVFPDRTDLWLMRFDIYRSLGLKAEFAESMLKAWDNPVLKRHLDWGAVRHLWEELAPGEDLPKGIILARPKAATATVDKGPGAARPASAGGSPIRRFSDIALQVAYADLEKMAKQYEALRAKPGFYTDFARSMGGILRRPTPLQYAQTISRALGGTARIYLKREDLRRVSLESEIATTHAYVGSALGKHLLITGNDVDAYSLALATVAPRFNMKCLIVMRPAELETKPHLVAELRGLGARIESIPPDNLKTPDPREAALRIWQKVADHCHLALSFGTGPRPYPTITNDFQALLGHETALQLRAHTGSARPQTFIAAVHSEADSIGFMLPHLPRNEIELIYAEPEGAETAWQPSRRLSAYNGAIREHAWLRATGRVTHVTIPDAQGQASQKQAAGQENISIGLEDARALALASMLVHRGGEERDIVVLVA